MAVRIVQAGKDGLSARVDDGVGLVVIQDIVVAAYGHEHSAFYGKGLLRGKSGIDAINHAVVEDHVNPVFGLALPKENWDNKT